jgi:GNAT superfamily N-acetyltransferase
MGEFKIKQIKDLLNIDMNSLAQDSKEEGFHFIERLINDYKSETNKFNKPGEALYGVFNDKGVIVSIGGLNIDPFSKESNIGRLRRFYVSKQHRRNGIGSLLLKEIICVAKNHFSVLVIHTDTVQGDQFYTSFGFSKGEYYTNSTHYLILSKLGV